MKYHRSGFQLAPTAGKACIWEASALSSRNTGSSEGTRGTQIALREGVASLTLSCLWVLQLGLQTYQLHLGSPQCSLESQSNPVFFLKQAEVNDRSLSVQGGQATRLPFLASLKLTCNSLGFLICLMKTKPPFSKTCLKRADKAFSLHPLCFTDPLISTTPFPFYQPQEMEQTQPVIGGWNSLGRVLSTDSQCEETCLCAAMKIPFGVGGN